MTDDDDRLSHAEYLHRRYPKPNDPRRSIDFGTRRADYETNQLLAAILDELQDLNVRMAHNDG